MTILLVEQNARMALGVSDRVLVLGKGAVVFAGAIAEFRQQEAELKGRYCSVVSGCILVTLLSHRRTR